MNAFTHIIKDPASFQGYERIFLDDGLYNHYLHRDSLHINTTLSIVTSFVRPEGVKPRESENYFEEAMYGDYSAFMSWKEIEEMSNRCVIAAHSHWHDFILTTRGGSYMTPWKKDYLKVTNEMAKFFPRVGGMLANKGLLIKEGKVYKRSQKEWEDYIAIDTESMMTAFLDNLGFVPRSYVMPFNHMNDHTTEILKTYGFGRIYGKERFELP